jgi:hypothetical protein
MRSFRLPPHYATYERLLLQRSEVHMKLKCPNKEPRLHLKKSENTSAVKSLHRASSSPLKTPLLYILIYNPCLTSNQEATERKKIAIDQFRHIDNDQRQKVEEFKVTEQNKKDKEAALVQHEERCKTAEVFIPIEWP